MPATVPHVLPPLLAAAVLLSPAAPARADTETVVTAALTFAPPAVSIAPGDSLEHLNGDPVPHNVTSEARDRRGNPLFSGGNASAGQRVAVRGVEALKPGAYPFYCSIHAQMRGTLNVGATTVVATPTGAVVASPTSIALRGDALYVTGYATGDVTRLPLLPGGLLGPPSTYAAGFDQPLGLAFGPDGTLYVSDSRSSGSGRVGRVRALAPGVTTAAAGAVVVDGLPNGRHATNGLAVRAGRLYVANGNNTDDGVSGGPPEQPLSGTLLSLPLSARNVPPRAGPKLVVEARGMRNLYDVAFRPGTAQAWIPTNGPDALDPWGEDLLHAVDVRGPAADFGFPACVYRTDGDRLVAGQNPNAGRRCHPRHKRPETSFGMHVSANGLAFGPPEWNGDLFVAEFGQNTGPPAGHKVVRVPMTGGRAGRPVDLVTAAAPLDVVFGPPGTGLYVADFVSGSITLVRLAG